MCNCSPCNCTVEKKQRDQYSVGVDKGYARAEYHSENNTKNTNPKDAVGIKKVPMSCIPAPVLAEVGLGLMEGARKYGRHNYRVAGARASVYYDAAMRHLMDYWEGTDIDPDSGINHISKAIATLMVMRDCQMNNMLTDDRPPRSREGWMQELNKAAEGIIQKYPLAKAAHTQKKDFDVV